MEPEDLFALQADPYPYMVAEFEDEEDLGK